MNIDKLSEQLNLGVDEIVHLIDELNTSYDLNIPTSGELVRPHYDVVRSLLDHGYLIRRLYAAGKPVEPSVFDKWVVTVDLSGYSTIEIELIAEGGPYSGLKHISRLMRANGYVSKVVYLGNEQQGRRWFKAGAKDITAAKKRAKHVHMATPSFL